MFDQVDIFQPDVYYLADNRRVTRVPRKDFLTFYGRAKHLYYIEDKQMRVRTYIPNQGQKILGDTIDKVLDQMQKTVGYRQFRGIALKPRQIGITTDTALRIFDMALIYPNFKALVANHLGEDTKVIFDKYQIVYRELSEFIEIIDEQGNVIPDENGNTLRKLKPITRADAANELRFNDPETKNYSWINVRTAGSGDNLGKGGTIQAFHVTEAANMTKYAKAVTSSMQQIPQKVDGFVMIESTANGTTGDGEGYYKEWVRAEAGYERYLRGEVDYYTGVVPIFIPWYVIDEYQMALQGGKLEDMKGVDFGGPEKEQDFYNREQTLQDEFGVSIERINWFRWIVKNNCDYNLSVAHRYYPTFPQDAFLSTDKCFFDSTKLHTIKKNFESGTLSFTSQQGYLDEDLVFTPSPGGELLIFKHPDPNAINRYILTADTSKGVEDGDYTSMRIFDRVEQEFVAHWFGRISEDLAAVEFNKLGAYYNYAYGIPESNLATLVNMIKPSGVLEYAGELHIDRVRNDGDHEYGFHTLGTSRKILLDEYKAWLRNNYDKFNELPDVEEHISFVRVVKASGMVKYEADTGKHDDRVISRALGIYANNRWDEEVAFLNDDKSDYTNIVKVGNISYNKPRSYQHSTIGREPGLSRIRVIGKHSKVGK
jgi:hypothetical protein